MSWDQLLRQLNLFLLFSRRSSEIITILCRKFRTRQIRLCLINGAIFRNPFHSSSITCIDFVVAVTFEFDVVVDKSIILIILSFIVVSFGYRNQTYLFIYFYTHRKLNNPMPNFYLHAKAIFMI